jgi:hypothetical protein
MATVGDDAWKSVRLAWEAELWLPVGAPVAALAYLLWVGFSGAAVGFLSTLALGPVTLDPWTASTDVVASVLLLVWIVAPATVLTWLVRDRLTTVRGTLEIGYRLGHPSLLLVPPVVVLLAAGLVVFGLDTTAVPVLAVLAAGAIWFLVRTLAYAYRVFAFSVPLVMHAVTLLSAGLIATAGLVVGARVGGRGLLVDRAAVSVATRLDSPALTTVTGGTVDLSGVAVPALVAVVVGVPVGLSLAYVGVQTVAGAVARLVKPTKRRPELRSGQRYPAFARPTTDVVPAEPPPSPPGPSDDGETAPAADAPTADRAESPASDDGDVDEPEPAPDLSNTRVYTASDDPPTVSPSSLTEECPGCGRALDPAAADGTCPECGADL